VGFLKGSLIGISIALVILVVAICALVASGSPLTLALDRSRRNRADSS